MLYLIATPIGNLKDLSDRAKETLASADTILCEDTRSAQVLLERHGIRRPLLPYHKFNEKKSLSPLLEALASGQTLALISDAGTPCINDPGQLLVDACHEKGLPVSAIPGPCSPIMALTLSGFAVNRFQFVGFVPKKPVHALVQALHYRGVTLFLESPERLVHTLETLASLAPSRKVAVAREMTKVYEECRRATAIELAAHYKAHPPKGEIVLVIEEGPPPEEKNSIEETLTLLQETFGISVNEAIKLAAHLRHTSKRDLYKKVHQDSLES